MGLQKAMLGKDCFPSSQDAFKRYFYLYFGIILDLQKICKGNTESSHILIFNRRFIFKNNLSTSLYMNINHNILVT